MPRGGASPPCQKHNVQDCVMCTGMPKAVQTDWAATGAHDAACNKAVDPPDNIEGWLNDGKADPVEAAIAKRVEPQTVAAQPPATPDVSFDVLPVDDSHASKVLRAAAAYAKASAVYAKAVVAVASLKIQLELEGAKLNQATEDRIAAEDEMKKLMGGQA